MIELNIQVDTGLFQLDLEININSHVFSFIFIVGLYLAIKIR